MTLTLILTSTTYLTFFITTTTPSSLALHIANVSIIDMTYDI